MSQQTTKHVIDCDTAPFIPRGLEVHNHIKGGQLEWNPQKVMLYLPEKQKTGWVIGFKIYDEIMRQPVLNANVLDYLLQHTELIPEEWEEKEIHFWGTIYRTSPSSIDLIKVRFLYRNWKDGKWYSYYSQIPAGQFCKRHPAAVWASRS